MQSLPDAVFTFTFGVFLFQLAYCVVQFLEKDPTLTEPVIFFCHSSHSKHKASSTKLVYAAEKLALAATHSNRLLQFFFLFAFFYDIPEKFSRNSLSSVQVIRGLLKFWPKTCSQKEVFSL